MTTPGVALNDSSRVYRWSRVDAPGRYTRFVTRGVVRALITSGLLFAALVVLPLTQPGVDSFENVGKSGRTLAAEARSRRAALNLRETAEETMARQTVLGYRACADGTSLQDELFFANSLGRLGSWADYAGTYTERASRRLYRVHIVYRIGVGNEDGREVEYVFVYDSPTGTVSAEDDTGFSYLRGLQDECAWRLPSRS
jgi:hypothetical protein